MPMRKAVIASRSLFIMLVAPVSGFQSAFFSGLYTPRNARSAPNMVAIPDIKKSTQLASCAPMNGMRSPAPAIVNSWTEWQPLQEIIVGRCEQSCIPHNEPAFEAKLRFKDHSLLKNNGMKRSDADVDKGEEEIGGLIDVLEARNVIVRRPELVDWSQPFRTPDFEAPCGNTGAMPRDVLLTVGNEVLEAPMSWRARFFEYRAYRSLLNEYFERDPNFVWTAGPKPTMNDAMYRSDFPHEARGEEADRLRKELAQKRIFCHTETEPIFDAADVMRLGRDLFVCNSFTTNRKVRVTRRKKDRGAPRASDAPPAPR